MRSQPSTPTASHGSGSSTDTSFPLFPFLPAEIRFAIWQLSCHSRVVTLSYSSRQARYHSPTKPPAILHACHEARSEALRIYSLAHLTAPSTTQGDHQSSPLEIERDQPVYLHPQLDILYVPRPAGAFGYADAARDLSAYLRFRDGTRLSESARRLALDYVPPEIRRPWETYNKLALIRSLPRLKEALLVLPSSADGHGSAHGQIELVDPRGDCGEILAIMERVRESFVHEAGGDLGMAGAAGLRGVEEEEDVNDVEVERGRDGNEWSRRESRWSVTEPAGVELVPKAKTWVGTGSVVACCS